MANPFDQFDTAPQGVPTGIPTRGADPKTPLEIERLRQQLRMAEIEAEQARAREARAREKEERDVRASEARGGVDTTESERTAAFLATRVAGGLRDLAAIGNIGAPTLKDAAVGGTLLGNYSTDEDRQRTINAQRDILDAALTLGTGAAYTQEQIDAYRNAYFPQPGDKPGTVADKTRRLQTLMEAARLKAGAASGLIDTAVAESNFFPSEKDGPLSKEQQRIYDAFMAANPNATADDLRTFAKGAGLPELQNADEIVKARKAGGGAAPASAAVYGEARPYEQSYLSQGLSGLNEGIASTLGAPVDIVNTALGLGARGVNAIANTNLSVSDRPFLGYNWWRGVLSDAGAVGGRSELPGADFVRRAGQSVGASFIPVGVGARTAGQAAGIIGSGLGGGIGAATAQEVAPGNPYAEIGGELLGGGIFGAGAVLNARRGAQQAIESGIPTVPELKQQASNLYREAELSGVTASPEQTLELADNMAGILRDEGRISPTGRISEVQPKIKEAYQLVSDYAGNPMNPTQMQTVRGIIGDAGTSLDANERRISGFLMDEFDQWADPLAPQLPEARAIANRYLNAQKLERARELAEARASQFSGSGLENALRTEYRNLDQNVIRGKERGLNDDVIAAVENVSRGTPSANVARQFGKLAPTGVVSFGLGSLAPAGLATTMFGPTGGVATGAAMSGLGMFGRKAAERLTSRAADVAELTARQGGPIPQASYLTPEIEKLISLGILGQQSQYLGDRPKP